MKPKKTTQDESKQERPARPPEAARKPDAASESSKPELEDEDTEVVPPDAGSAEAEAEKAQERADDDGMPAGDAPRPDSGR